MWAQKWSLFTSSSHETFIIRDACHKWNFEWIFIVSVARMFCNECSRQVGLDNRLEYHHWICIEFLQESRLTNKQNHNQRIGKIIFFECIFITHKKFIKSLCDIRRRSISQTIYCFWPITRHVTTKILC